MMAIRKIILCTSLSLFLINHCLAAKDPTITYKNQRGSMMTLTWHSSGQNVGELTGTFTTAVGNCKEDIGVPLPLAGFFNGNAISVIVNFPHCKQVVAMTGNLNNDSTNIHTIWLDANQADDPQGQNWNTNIIGSDTYQKIE
jgi:hypothetical protein